MTAMTVIGGVDTDDWYWVRLGCMGQYVPIFSRIVHSSLWREDAPVRVLFLTLLALKDSDHVVRVELHHLPRLAGLSGAEVKRGLEVLESPDRFMDEAMPQPFDGRRIARVEDGWMILNGGKYQGLMSETNKRARWARAQRKRRERLGKGKALSGAMDDHDGGVGRVLADEERRREEDAARLRSIMERERGAT